MMDMGLTEQEFLALSPEDQKDYLDLLQKLEETRKYNKINYFQPYPFQKRFYDLGKDQPVRALIAANRCGKTYSAAMELSYHATGNYPDWWEGRVFDRPVTIVAAGVTSHQVKRVLQKEFIGTIHRDRKEEIGTGSLPRHTIDMKRSVGGRDGLLPEIAVRHKDGGYSTIILYAYAQDVESMMGFTADIVYVDEQDKNKFDLIFSELVKRISSVNGLAMATFTPLAGVTHIVRQFWDPTGEFHKGLVNAGWDDIEHLTEDVKEQMLAATPPHLRDAVSKGIPVLGSGAVYNIGEGDLMYDDVEIKDDWPRIAAMDVGFTNDPTAGVFVAKDLSTGIYYVYDEFYGESGKPHAEFIGPLFSKGCANIPIIYDSAAVSKTGKVGEGVRDLWQEHGLNVLQKSFRNPKWLSEGTSSYKDKAVGIQRVFELMSSGKLKIHARTCPNVWREFRAYSYDDKGVPVDKDDHWMDALRYAILSAEGGLMESINGNGWGNVDEYYDSDEFYFNSY